MAKALPVTDKSMKKGTLSVNLDEILAELVEQRHFKKDSFPHKKIKGMPCKFNQKQTAFVQHSI